MSGSDRAFLTRLFQLVDTKAADNKTTLLHFLEKTVSSKFPEMETFLDELSKPADAFKCM
jgi:cytokinesis protein